MDFAPSRTDFTPAELISHSTLSGNLLTLSRCSNNPDLLDCALPGVFSSTISTNGVVHTFRVVIYKFLDLILGKEYRLKKMGEALRKTQNTFQRVMEDFNADINQRNALLLRLKGGIEIEPKTWFEINNRLIHTINLFSYLPVDKGFKKTIENITTVASTLLGSEAEDPAIFIRINECYQMIDNRELLNLESFSQTIPPYDILESLSLIDGKRTPEVENKVRAWIETLENSGIQPNQLHKALKAFVSGLKNNTSQLNRLEAQLYKLGLKRLMEPDAEHLKWRDTLKAGVEIDPFYTLGEKLEGKKSQNDQRHVYTIDGYSELVVMIGPNLAYLGISRYLSMNDPLDCAIPEITEDKDHYLVVQKMKSSLAGMDWKEGTVRKQEAFKELILNIIDTGKTPILNPQDFMFTNFGEIKCIRSLTWKDEVDKDALRDFIMKVSNGNYDVFSFVFTSSELLSSFYEDIVRNSNAETNIDNLAAHHRISDPKIRARGKWLHERVTRLKREHPEWTSKINNCWALHAAVDWPNLEEHLQRVE